MDKEKQELILIVVLFGLIVACIVLYYNSILDELQKQADAKAAADAIIELERQKRIADANMPVDQRIQNIVQRTNKGTTFNLDLAKIISGL